MMGSIPKMLNRPKKLNGFRVCNYFSQFAVAPFIFSLKQLGHTWAHFALITSARRVSYFWYPSDPVFTKTFTKGSDSHFLCLKKKQTYTPGQGINKFLKQNLISSCDASSQKLENSQLSLSGSHQLIIIINIIILKNKGKITIKIIDLFS
jgi:hypothetical protein